MSIDRQIDAAQNIDIGTWISFADVLQRDHGGSVSVASARYSVYALAERMPGTPIR
jgi:soluble lytic murein transglycosylase-like protein